MAEILDDLLVHEVIKVLVTPITGPREAHLIGVEKKNGSGFERQLLSYSI